MHRTSCGNRVTMSEAQTIADGFIDMFRMEDTRVDDPRICKSVLETLTTTSGVRPEDVKFVELRTLMADISAGTNTSSEAFCKLIRTLDGLVFPSGGAGYFSSASYFVLRLDIKAAALMAQLESLHSPGLGGIEAYRASHRALFDIPSPYLTRSAEGSSEHALVQISTQQEEWLLQTLPSSSHLPEAKLATKRWSWQSVKRTLDDFLRARFSNRPSGALYTRLSPGVSRPSGPFPLTPRGAVGTVGLEATRDSPPPRVFSPVSTPPGKPSSVLAAHTNSPHRRFSALSSREERRQAPADEDTECFCRPETRQDRKCICRALRTEVDMLTEETLIHLRPPSDYSPATGKGTFLAESGLKDVDRSPSSYSISSLNAANTVRPFAGRSSSLGSTGRSPAFSFGSARQRGPDFSWQEDHALFEGILLHGNDYAQILQDKPRAFQETRTPDTLRGRVARLRQNGRLPPDVAKALEQPGRPSPRKKRRRESGPGER